MMRHASFLPATLVALSIAMVGGTPAAQAQAEPVTLRFAVSDPNDGRPSQVAVDSFVEQVATLSGGTLIVEPVFLAGENTPEKFEVGVAGLVERGDADLALVASRAWDLAGVTSLQALQAPFLITDDTLAAAVAQSDISDNLLQGMADAGVTGLALWPEDLRHPFSWVPDQPLVSPEDFVGDTILVQPSALSRALVEALGAHVFADDMDRGQAVEAGLLHGAETGLLQGGSLSGTTPTATGDVVFYPKFQVLVANSAAFGRLTGEQQQLIRDAATATRDAAIASHPSEADAAAAWCEIGGRVVLAGPEGIAAFKAAAQPIFDQISTDPVTAAAIAAIRELAATVEPAPGATACAPDAVAEPTFAVSDTTDYLSTVPPNGTYRIDASADDYRTRGARPTYAELNAGTWTWAFTDGSWVAVHEGTPESCRGSYATVDDKFVRFTNGRSDGCGMAYDIVWRPADGGISMVLVGLGWEGSTADFKDEQTLIERTWFKVD